MVDTEFLIEQLKAYHIPRHMHQGVINYVKYHIAPGSFLMYLLQNDFLNAVNKADGSNFDKLGTWGVFMLNTLPIECYGSKEKVTEWLKQKEGTTIRGMD